MVKKTVYHRVSVPSWQILWIRPETNTTTTVIFIWMSLDDNPKAETNTP